MNNSQKKKISRKSIPLPIKNLLWQNSAGRCCKPGCGRKCVIDGTDEDNPVTVGKIAHIFSYSDGGPRSNPDLLTEERNEYDNLVLLCGICHDEVDGQENEFTVSIIKSWKKDHEDLVNRRLAQEIFSHAELEIITKFVANENGIPSDDFSLRDITDKIAFNNLSPSIQSKISIGSLKAGIVRGYIDHQHKMDSTYAERLVSPLKSEYNRLKADGYDADYIFNQLHYFASGHSIEFNLLTAGLAVVYYFFECCELFEK